MSSCGNVIAIEPLIEAKDVPVFNPNDMNYTKNARKGYSQIICVEYPELKDICMAFYYYPVCSYVASKTNRSVTASLEQYWNNAVDSGLDQDNDTWQFVLRAHKRCMEQTTDICLLVKKTIAWLKRESNKAGNKCCDAGRALRALNLYIPDFDQEYPPYKRNEPSQIILALQYINIYKGAEFHKAFNDVRKNPMVYANGSTFSCYHQTELLLELYKKYLYVKACDKLEILNDPDFDGLHEIVEATKDKMGAPDIKTAAAGFAVKLVECTLASLKRYKDDGLTYYKSIVRHYINQTPITACGLEEWNNSWRGDYETRNRAIKTYSIFLWGYSSINIVELLETTYRGGKKNVRRERALDIL